jgi:lysyl-tRNA synthetase class 2
VYVLGRRVHEWQLGLALAIGALSAWGAGALDGHVTPSVVPAAAWLVVKDWRDVLPGQRDTTAGRIGVHKRLAELRTTKRASWLPPLTAGTAALIATVNLVSALTPNVGWRRHLLLRFEPVEAVPLFHALALPASAGLLVTALYLGRRRRRAWQLAFAILLALAVLNVLKGLDAEEAALDVAFAALLWWARGAFEVRHDPITLGSAIWRLPALALGTVGLALGTALAAAPRGAGATTVLRETVDLLLWSDGPVHFRDELMWLPIGIGAASALALGVGCYVVFRPLAAPRSLPSPELRRAAAALVRINGRDTLAFFKLRRDAQYLFEPSRRAFAAYRVEGGVLVVSGDPVGPADALPALVGELCRFADLQGLRVAAVGASESMLELWRAAGLRSLYLGDEAIVDTAGFSLDGRRIRKVRQSVSRLEREGYRVELIEPERLDAAALAELEAVNDRWRDGKPERGFSMAMDSVSGAGSRHAARRGTRRSRRRARLHPLRADVRPGSNVALGHAARPRNTERTDGVPRRPLARAPGRARRRGDFAELRRFQPIPAQPLRCR